MDMIERIRAGEFESNAPHGAARNTYREGQRVAEQLFKEAALEDVGLTDHPKADKAFGKAWSDGHSSGYNEVYYQLEELAELLKD